VGSIHIRTRMRHYVFSLFRNVHETFAILHRSWQLHIEHRLPTLSVCVRETESKRQRERVRGYCLLDTRIRLAFQLDFEICEAPQIAAADDIPEKESDTSRYARSILFIDKNIKFRSLFRLPESEVLLSDLFPAGCNLDWKGATSYGVTPYATFRLLSLSLFLSHTLTISLPPSDSRSLILSLSLSLSLCVGYLYVSHSFLCFAAQSAPLSSPTLRCVLPFAKIKKLIPTTSLMGLFVTGRNGSFKVTTLTGREFLFTPLSSTSRIYEAV
jgi:hypothetical protein